MSSMRTSWNRVVGVVCGLIGVVVAGSAWPAEQPVAIFHAFDQRREANKKFVTRWGTWSRGGMEVQARDALYFVREPWSQCQAR